MMVEAARATAQKRVFCHVDMDGLATIFQAHGRTAPGPNTFFESAVDNSIAFFAEHDITATYFLIARDLANPEKRAAAERLVAAGHHIASHSLNHAYLNRLTDTAAKREEIFGSKARIEDTLGVRVEGFRAPGYSIDYESLQLLVEAGYRYDSSIFPSYAFRKRLGVQRLYPEPFLLFPEHDLFEFPMPCPAPGLPPFHPCYAFYLGRRYFRRNLHRFRTHHNHLTLLFHLTDFAAPQRIGGNVRMNLFTNNYFTVRRKLAFLASLMKEVRADFTPTTSEDLIAGWPQSAPDLNPRTILGISTTHETGACVVQDGRTLSAINEERLSRRKLDTTYPPKRSIREAIRISGIAPEEIDAVAIAGLSWRDLLPQTLDSLWQDVKDYHALNDYIPHLCRIFYRLFYFWRAVRYGTVLDFLRHEYGIAPKVFFIEHHEAHAASAFRTSPAQRALIVTADGVGDDVCITINRADDYAIQRVDTYFYPNSFGQFYTACTQMLGFKAGRHEGKITGLSGYGQPNQELMQSLEGTFFNHGRFKLNKRYYAEGFIRLKWRDLKNLLRGRIDPLAVDYRNYKPPLRRLIRGYTREEVAYAFQHILEREMCRLTQPHVPNGSVHLGLAGGVFANVKLNMAMSHMPGVKSVYVFPNMGDGGLCVGAALNIAGKRPRVLPDMYLGTDFNEDELVAALEKFRHVPYERPDDLTQRVAQELADNRIVARFDGRMEFGPRALGNRSILYHCSDPSVNAWLNHQLRRTEFMPFAPICIYEDAEDYFILREGEKRPCEFMTLVVRCTDRMRETCPAAVHVDGTARPQLLRRHTNPGMYDILQAYKRLTGISCIINTSFNMHEEPIVRTPEEAIVAFQQSHLHYLIMGPFLVRQPDSIKPRVRASAAREFAWS